MAVGTTTRFAAPASTGENPIWHAYETPRDDRTQLRAWDDDGYREYTWDDWRRGAERAACGLRARGVEPGARVAAVLTNRFEVCAAVIGTWMAGAVLLSLPTLRRGQDPADYVEQLRRLCGAIQPEALLLEERFRELLGDQSVGAPVVTFEALPREGAFEPVPLADDATAFVQFSSGSTSDPKGCVLSMGAVGAQERMLARRLEVDGDSRGVMWLPLSHDMGLFGCVLLSWASGMRLTVGTPERFLRKPRTWMDDCVEFDATITAGPNFGLGLAARHARRQPPKGRFPLRTFVLGGERIEWVTIRDATDALGPYGVEMRSITPAYGLAEATLAVTMKHLDQLPEATTIDAEAAYRGKLVRRAANEAGTLSMVSCGPAMDGVSVRVDGDGALGRICIRSEALASGYLDHPEQTRSRFVGGELITEDIGFLENGELHVLGRTDDAIAVGGRNIYARDVEIALGECGGARPGCVTLVDVATNDERRLTLLAEPSADCDDLGELATSMADVAYRTLGVRPHECVLVRPGSLPKTPSGKIQRFRCRALLAVGADEIVDRVAL
jgi:fatty-acyl-CoA synthase